eukprot:6178166-Pleurochrysis_carterae.AAC.4
MQHPRALRSPDDTIYSSSSSILEILEEQADKKQAVAKYSTRGRRRPRGSTVLIRYLFSNKREFTYFYSTFTSATQYPADSGRTKITPPGYSRLKLQHVINITLRFACVKMMRAPSLAVNLHAQHQACVALRVLHRAGPARQPS